MLCFKWWGGKGCIITGGGQGFYYYWWGGQGLYYYWWGGKGFIITGGEGKGFIITGVLTRVYINCVFGEDEDYNCNYGLGIHISEEGKVFYILYTIRRRALYIIYNQAKCFIYYIHSGEGFYILYTLDDYLLDSGKLLWDESASMMRSLFKQGGFSAVNINKIYIYISYDLIRR